MNGTVQRVLIGAYSLINKTGVLRTRPCKLVFRKSYFAYKRLLEDPLIVLIKAAPNVCRNGLIIDVGANLGYTSLLFSHYAAAGCEVIAFEPDRANFETLKEVVRGRSSILPVWAAVGDEIGEVRFWSNPGHHADSRTVTPEFQKELGEEEATYAVPLVSLDAYLERERQGCEVGFIKIDVQGYEEKVLRGCEATILKNPDVVVAFEYSPESARELGFSPEFQLSFFLERGFKLYSLSRAEGLLPFRSEDLPRLLEGRGYCDLVASRSPLC
ncbi:MAG: FkbM family methyltransferase [Pseudomonadota bacterium]|jgi:FkbM family methyltransferase